MTAEKDLLTVAAYQNGIRQITIEVSRYSPDFTPRAFMCRVYSLNAHDRIAIGIMGNPRAALALALEDFDRMKAEKPTAAPGTRHPSRAAASAPTVQIDMDDLI